MFSIDQVSLSLIKEPMKELLLFNFVDASCGDSVILKRVITEKETTIHRLIHTTAGGNDKVNHDYTDAVEAVKDYLNLVNCIVKWSL